MAWINASSAALVAWLVFVAVSDFRYRRVPNWVVLTGAALALLVLILGAQPLGVTYRESLTAALIGFAFLLVFYGLGLMGAADVKFAAALGLWLGFWPLMWVWVGASLVAGMHAIVLLCWRGQRHQLRAGKREIPYAAHMAMVTMGWLLWQHHIS